MRISNFICFVLLLLPFFGNGQTDSSTFILGLEYRPRFEFRNGYGALPNDTTSPAAFVSQRSRLGIYYWRPKFIFHASIQDIRVWGQYGQQSSANGLGIFESYVTAKFNKKWSVKMGRQGVEFDNGRLFSKANWSQAARAHEGIRFIFVGKKLYTQLMTFYNQSGEQVFGSQYSPTTPNYTTLSIHYLYYDLNKKTSLILVNSADGYQNTVSPSTMYLRATTGGRLSFTHQGLKLTMAGYYQFGQLQTGNQISAYYLQPEISYKGSKLLTRLGMEYLSGNDGTQSSEISNSFQTLYGVAFKFMGNLNQFTRFPESTADGGLVNPYLFFRYKVNQKLRFKLETHAFFSQNNVVYNNEVIDKYLGVESDFKVKYLINDYSSIEGGVAYMLPTESLGIIKNTPDYKNPFWSFVMVKFNPELFRTKKAIKK